MELKNSEVLRNTLFDALEKLQAKRIDPAQAVATARLAIAIMATMESRPEYIKTGKRRQRRVVREGQLVMNLTLD